MTLTTVSTARTAERQLDKFVDIRAFRPRPTTNLQQLTVDEAESFARDGFILLRRRLSLDFVEVLKAAADTLMSIDRRSVKNIERYDPAFASVYEVDPVRGIVEDLNGPSTMYQSFAFFKQPWEMRPKPWHQDSVYWNTTSEALLNVFVPLTSASKQNGAVHLIRGSHRLGRLYHWVEDDGFGFKNLVCDVSPFKEPVVATVEPGDLIVSHNLTIHASFANSTDAVRTNIGFHHRALDTRVEFLGG